MRRTLIGRLLAALGYRRAPPPERITGVFGAVDRDGIGWIRPLYGILDRDVPVSVRAVRSLGLKAGDRVQFEVSTGTGEAVRVRCDRRVAP